MIGGLHPNDVEAVACRIARRLGQLQAVDAEAIAHRVAELVRDAARAERACQAAAELEADVHPFVAEHGPGSKRAVRRSVTGRNSDVDTALSALEATALCIGRKTGSRPVESVPRESRHGQSAARCGQRPAEAAR